jgi:hypothetical protein
MRGEFQSRRTARQRDNRLDSRDLLGKSRRSLRQLNIKRLQSPRRSRIQVRSYETNDGQKRKITEVVAGHVEFLDRKLENKDNPFGGEVLPEEELPF